MAQYGWQNTVACVGKWLRSNVWNRLSSGRVWKMTALCILQKSLLIDFIYLGGGGMVTDGGDNWRKKEKRKKKKSGFFTLSWHPVLVRVVGTFKGDRTIVDSPIHRAAAFPTAQLGFCSLFPGLGELKVAGSAYRPLRWHCSLPGSVGEILEIICERGTGRNWYRSP